MSSLNQAFFKAYGREAAPPAKSDAAPPATAPSASPNPPSQVTQNWYSADAWYRVEAPLPVASAPVAAPHVIFPPTGYQPPTPQDLNRLAARALPSDDPEYRLSPVETVARPEVVIEEEAAAKKARVISAPPSTRPAPPATKVSVTLPPVNAPDLMELYAPVQVISGWEAMLGTAPAITTVGPTPVVVPATPKTAPPTPRVEVKAPRLDAAISTPVPKAHATFAAPPVETTPREPTITPVNFTVAKSATVAPAMAPPMPAQFTAPLAPIPSPLPKFAPPLAKSDTLVPLQPAWEVDRFQWSEQCRQLLATENKYLSDVGARLANATREGLNILAVTSTRRGEGRTTLALCLSRAAAAAGVKVALVDADIENPQLVHELGVEAACGWQEVILGQQPLSEAAIASIEDKLAFFPWIGGGTIKSLNDPRATRVLREIARSYSLVVLDLGPVPGRETRLFEDNEQCPVDAAILVRDVRWTSAIEAQRVAAQLTTAGVASVGLAENFGPRS